MKGSEQFQKVIKEHLDNLAAKDELFAKTYQKEGKTIEDCIKYILQEVEASKCNGFDDAEIFNMAVHYYDEDDIVLKEEGKGMRVVINRVGEITEEDRQEMMNKVMHDELEKYKNSEDFKNRAAKVASMDIVLTESDKKVAEEIAIREVMKTKKESWKKKEVKKDAPGITQTSLF